MKLLIVENAKNKFNSFVSNFKKKRGPRRSQKLNVKIAIDEAIALAQTGELRKSITILDDILKKQPENFEVLINKGVVLEFSENLLDAFKCFDFASKINPSSDIPLVYMGNILAKQTLYEDAIALYSAALKLNPNSKEGQDNKELAIRYKASVIKEHQSKKIIPPILISNNELGESKQNIELLKVTWNNLSNVYRKMGAFEESIKCSNKTIGLDPSYSKGWYSIAYTCVLSNQIAKARVACEQCLKIDPNFENALELMKIILKEEKKH